jgi:hypothetical protein
MTIVDVVLPWLAGASVGMALLGAMVLLLPMLLERTALPAKVRAAPRRVAPRTVGPLQPRPAAPGRPSAAWQALALLPS